MGGFVAIDGDLLPYSIGFACQKTTYMLVGPRGGVKKKDIPYKKDANKLLEDFPNCTIEPVIEAQPVHAALHTVKVTIKKILEGSKCDRYKIYLTGRGNFREKVATILKYKGNRDNSSKPVHYQAIRDYLVEHHGALVCDGIEADDAVSIVQMKYRRAGKRSVIASFDKDLNCTPGLHYNFKYDKPEEERLYDVTDDEANYFFYKQILTGDKQTDNIGGIPRIGPKKAEKILQGCVTEEELYKAVLGAYEKYYSDKPDEYYHWNDPLEQRPIKYTPKDMLIENARLLYMLRDPATNPVKLWEPPL